MGALRLLLLAIAMALGTVLLAWWAVPLVAAAYGVALHASRWPGTSAAAAAAAAWGGYLGLLSLGGAPLIRFASVTAVSMQLPSWALLVATLLFPALLAGPASYLGARIGARYLPPS